MENDTIEILLAVYNGDRYLAEFLDSLLAQTTQDFRLIVSDNRSTDRTGEILNEYKSKFRYGIHVLPLPDATVPSLLNFARVTEASSASYVMYADADDVWYPQKVEKTFAAMKAAEAQYGNDTPILVHSDLEVVDEKLGRIAPSFWAYQYSDPHRTRLNKLLVQNCVTGCTTMLNRTLFDLGRPIPKDACVHDYWYALTASAFGRIVPIRAPLLKYRQHGSNVTGARAWNKDFIMRRVRQLWSGDTGWDTMQWNLNQARAFLERFGTRLQPDQRRVVSAFVNLRSESALSRRVQLARYGFWKLGLIRNLGLLFMI